MTSIGDWAFVSYSGLTSINIPGSVTSIGRLAFSDCSNLTSINIPSSVTVIADGAFWGCSSLTSISIPSGVTSIEGSVFKECSSLTSISILGDVTGIWNEAFADCSSLISISIPNSVTVIAERAFSDCCSLAGISIPDNVTRIGSGAFSGCSSLASIEVDGSNTTYDSRENCNAVIETKSNTLILGCKATVIPNSVTSIGNSAFYDCSSLTSISIPSSVTDIGRVAFAGCSSLASIKVDGNNTKYDSRENCNAIVETESNTLISGCKATVIPNSVTSIGNSAFRGCSGLTSINIPSSVTDIGEDAFWGCSSLTSISIPSGATSIGKSAFWDCSSLTSINIPRSVTSIGRSAFTGCSKNLVIYGYSGSAAEAYANQNSRQFVAVDIVTEDISQATVTLDETTYTYDGTAKTPSVTVELNGKTLIPDTDYTVAYSNNTNVGTAEVTVTGKGSYAGSKKANFTISKSGSTEEPDKADISKATVTLDKTSYTYDGTAKTPSVTVKLDGKTLILNTDYTVAYSNNTNAGAANVTLTGKGGYTGTKSVNFTIVKAPENPDSSITCKKTVYDLAYGAKPFQINASSGSKLTFTSSNSKIASVDKNTGKVTIKGTGVAVITIKSNSDSVKVTVKVSPKKPSLKSVKVSKGKKLTVKWAKDKSASGYQVQVSASKDFKKNSKQKNVTKTSYTFTRLKAGQKYYVRVRSYKKSGKETLYGAWSSKKQSSKVKK